MIFLRPRLARSFREFHRSVLACLTIAWEAEAASADEHSNFTSIADRFAKDASEAKLRALEIYYSVEDFIF